MKRIVLFAALLAALQGCAVKAPMPADEAPPTLTPRTSTYQQLLNLPTPRGKLVAAVYGFRDQTGQYKPNPASSFSTAVTQGAASMLVDALQASGWFVVLEREGLQNILTERKIIRASQNQPDVAPNIKGLTLAAGCECDPRRCHHRLRDEHSKRRGGCPLPRYRRVTGVSGRSGHGESAGS